MDITWTEGRTHSESLLSPAVSLSLSPLPSPPFSLHLTLLFHHLFSPLSFLLSFYTFPLSFSTTLPPPPFSLPVSFSTSFSFFPLSTYNSPPLFLFLSPPLLFVFNLCHSTSFSLSMPSLSSLSTSPSLPFSLSRSLYQSLFSLLSLFSLSLSHFPSLFCFLHLFSLLLSLYFSLSTSNICTSPTTRPLRSHSPSCRRRLRSRTARPWSCPAPRGPRPPGGRG